MTAFAAPYRPCGPGSAAFFVHSVRGRADRVTICAWILELQLAQLRVGRPWDTTTSINAMRAEVAAYPPDPEGPELEALIANRNAAFAQHYPEMVRLYQAGQISDIDLSVGFDSWLIYIVSRPRLSLPRWEFTKIHS